MSKSPFWNEDWMQVQQNYWQQWNEMSKRAAGMAQPPKAPWEQAMDHWWEAIAPQSQNSASSLMEKMMTQGKQFFRMIEGMQQGVAQQKGLNESLDDIFEQFRGKMKDFSHSSMEKLAEAEAMWMSPMQNWQKFAAKSLPMGSDMALKMDASQFLGAPGLGYSRETEDQHKQLMLSVVEYQEAMQLYFETLADLGPLSVDRLKKKVMTLNEAGKSIDSARQLFDLWVAASEEVYGERTITAEYAEVHGNLVNALMKVKREWQTILDDRLAAMGMPTQREMRTMQDRMQETRRELRGMRSEMAALRRELAAAKKSASVPAVAATKKAAPKRTATKKNAAKKKATRKTAAK